LKPEFVRKFNNISQNGREHFLSTGRKLPEQSAFFRFSGTASTGFASVDAASRMDVPAFQDIWFVMGGNANAA
jgi:hypothetical protein